jgi:hypothetical protein
VLVERLEVDQPRTTLDRTQTEALGALVGSGARTRRPPAAAARGLPGAHAKRLEELAELGELG